MKKQPSRFIKRLLHKLRIKKNNNPITSRHGYWWVIALLFSSLIPLMLISTPMRVQSIECTRNGTQACPDYIIPGLTHLHGQLIYLLDIPSIQAIIQSVMPHAQTIEIIKLWPGILSVQITDQYDIANLKTPATESALIIGNHKYITGFTDTPTTTLPTIVASEAAFLRVGESVVDQGISTAADIALALPSVRLIHIRSPLEIQVTDVDNQRYLFTSVKPVAIQQGALQLILATTTINEMNYIVDVRYDRPVLKLTW